jgi:Flp pilus assembly protein TadD
MCRTRTLTASPSRRRADGLRRASLTAILLAGLLGTSALAAEPKEKGPSKAEIKAAAAEAAALKASPTERIQADRLDPLGRATFWAHEFSIDDSDVQAGTRLAAALRALGQFTEAAETAKRVLVINPDAYDALLESARAYIAQTEGFYAIEPARRAMTLQPKDWHPVSLLGVALEQVGRDEDALAAYGEALKLSPDNPAILSNLAMFHASRGDAAQAETLLRKAIGRPGGATTQIRQNLSLVLGYQGKLAEAEKMLREDLPPAMADNNIAYLKAVSGNLPAAPDRPWPSPTAQ